MAVETVVGDAEMIDLKKRVRTLEQMVAALAGAVIDDNHPLSENAIVKVSQKIKRALPDD